MFSWTNCLEVEPLCKALRYPCFLGMELSKAKGQRPIEICVLCMNEHPPETSTDGCGCGGGGRISPRAESPKNDARSVVALVGSDGLSLLSGDYGLTTFAIRPYSTRHSTQHQQANAIVIASRTIGSSLGRLAISSSPLSPRLPRPSHGFRILQRRLRVAEQPMQ